MFVRFLNVHIRVQSCALLNGKVQPNEINILGDMKNDE